MNANTPPFEYWNKRRRQIRSNRGGWVAGRGISNRGYSMMDDLVGEKSFFQVLILNVTGRLPELRFAQWLEATFICCSWPDPRIWCNQVGTFGASGRTTPIGAVSAGVMASDATIYGPNTATTILPFLKKAREELAKGCSVKDFLQRHAHIKGRLMVPGFARPVATGDERVVAMRRTAEKLGFDQGEYETLAYQIHDFLYEEFGEAINLAGYMGAFMLDQGYKENEIHQMLSMLVNSGIHACYAEYREQAPGAYLPLRCDDIEYVGVERRVVPKKPKN